MDTYLTPHDAGDRPTFPQEIFDLIIDALGDMESQFYIEEIRDDSVSDSEMLLSYRDMSGLLACNLVCRAFSDRARQHLFRRVEMIPLDSENDVDTWLDKFCLLLQWRPKRNPDGVELCGVCPYIKEFAASDTNDSEAHMAPETQDRLAEVLWALNSKEYGIQELDLGIELVWTDLTLSLRHSIVALVQSDHLKTLKVYGFINLDPTFWLDSKIKHLCAVECFTNVAHDHPLRAVLINSGHLYPNLESLETDCSLPAAHFVRNAGDGMPHSAQPSSSLNGLRRLSVWMIDDRVFRSEVADLLLAHVAQNLQRLEVRFYPVPRMTLPNFHPTLRGFAQLRHLQLYYCEGTSQMAQITFPEAFIKFFSSESTILPQNLESLEIYIAHPYIYTDMEDLASPFSRFGEDKVTMIDRKLSLHSSLRKATLRVRLHPSILAHPTPVKIDDFVRDASSILQNLFLVTTASNLLDIRFEFLEDFDYYYSRNLEVFVPEVHPMANI